MNKMRADYTTELIDGVVCVVDLDQGGMSVTNDAERVVADLHERGWLPFPRPVIYCDSMGCWDQLVIKDRAFAGFRSLGDTEDRATAMARVKDIFNGKE